MEKGKIRKVPEYLEPYFDEASQFQYYYEYIKHNKSFRNIEDKFVCLRGFSSSTPIINSAVFGRECLGGGFYFRYKGQGIAIDPGIGFVSLMHRNNIFIDDIDIVIVTHAHIDHNCDVGRLSALNYDYNKNRERESKFYKQFFTGKMAEKHNIIWYMDAETIRSTKEILKYDDVYCLGDYCDGNSAKLTEDIQLSAIRTQHEIHNHETYGVSLNFKTESGTKKWGYTSDTAYFKEIGDFFINSDVLLFNISDMYIADVEGIKSKHGHLGFDGSINLLEQARPSVALTSEFCCMNGDYRYEMVKALREYSGSTLVFPSDPGLVMGIADGSMRCSLCQKDFSLFDIRVARPEQEYGKIQYICSNCMF